MSKKFYILFMLVLMSGCIQPEMESPDETSNDLISVVATTTIVGDVVSQVARDQLSVSVIIPTGTDPHHFDPAPGEARIIADASVVFVNGLGLDEFVFQLIEDTGRSPRIVNLSEGLDLRVLETVEDHDEHDDHAGQIDPHVWMDPNNIIGWVEMIADTLSDLDPEHADLYAANAATYIEQLIELDQKIISQIDTIPVDRRRLVTDHDSFGYFADRYGLELVGFVVPGFSTLAQPSAQEFAALIEKIELTGVEVIFVDPSFNPALAEAIASDAGVELVPIYSGSLSSPDGPADSYLMMMETNLAAIVVNLLGN